jgi:hypothetical protein
MVFPSAGHGGNRSPPERGSILYGIGVRARKDA